MQKSPGGGVTLRIYGRSFSPPAQVAGDTEWKTLDADFSLAEPEETELICEVRAFKGTVWFEKASLQIARAPKQTKFQAASLECHSQKRSRF